MTEPSDISAQPSILGYDESLEEEIFQFQKAEYPARREDWIAPRWRWMFVDSARRMGVEPMVWLCRNGSAIVGHHGAIPVTLKVGDEEHFTAWSVETMVSASMRGKRIGPLLVGQAQGTLPLNLSLGQTPQMRAIQLRTGWQQVAPLETYVYVLNASRLLTGKLGGALPRRVAAMGLAALQRIKHLAGRRRLSWRPSIAEIDRFGDRHDQLWATVKGEYACAVVRDASYLNWKYVDQPGQRYLRLEIRNREKVVAIAVLSIAEPDSIYRYRRGLLVDLVVSPSDTGAVWAALEQVRAACESRDVDLIVFHLINEKLARSVVKFGFTAREAERFLLLSTGGSTEHVSRQVLEPTNWLVTLGDSDIDRPW